MTTPAILLDVLLAGLLVVLAWRLLFGRDLITSTVLFVAFGLTMALVWSRLQAPDVALAEAAVGAGLTGALVLGAAGGFVGTGRPARVRRRWALAVIVMSTLAGATTLALLVSFDWPRPGLTSLVLAEAADADVASPVTAVLLMFRGYDTWLELGVLLVATIAVLGLPATFVHARARPPKPSAVLSAFVRLAAPTSFVIAALLVWLGTTAPGGAFQGAATGAAALVLGFLAGSWTLAIVRRRRTRPLIVAAVALPLLATVPALLSGRSMFSYPVGDPKGWILLLEVTLGFSVALTLAALFQSARPTADPGDE